MQLYNVAILDFVNQKSLYVIKNMFMGLLDHKNMWLDTNFAFLSALVPKIWVFKNFEWWPFWKIHKKYISHSRIVWVFFCA